MSRRRHEILRAISEASLLLSRYPTGNRTSFDVIGAAIDLDIPVVFRPLDGLWGAALTVEDAAKGILVTTKLDLAVQRFTLAHELGHVVLGHSSSFDATNSINFEGRLGPASKSTEEVAADAFASELLAPKKLMKEISQRHGWDTSTLKKGDAVYQMSLRLGLSFPATCWALAAHQVFTKEKARLLQTQKVKHFKRRAAPDDLSENPWADRWVLSAADAGTCIEAKPDDIFAIRVEDYASAGFLWELEDLDGRFKVLREEVGESHAESYNKAALRVMYVTIHEPGSHVMRLAHKRRWSKEVVQKIEISVVNYGKEVGGFPRVTREAQLASIA